MAKMVGRGHSTSRYRFPADASLSRSRMPATTSPSFRRPSTLAPEWQAAMQALILVAESGGPTMLARIGVMRALNRHVERVFNPDRKDPLLGKAETGAGPIT